MKEKEEKKVCAYAHLKGPTPSFTWSVVPQTRNGTVALAPALSK